MLGAGREKKTLSGSLDSNDVKQVLADDAPAIYAAPGWLLFVRNGALMAQTFDADNRELTGDALQITRPTADVSLSGIPFSVSDNGVLVWQGDRQRQYQLVWFDRQGRQSGSSGPPMGVSIGQSPDLSPDDKRVIIQRVDPQTQNQDIWVIDVARDLPTRLTTDAAAEQLPIWSSDGNSVVFDAIRGGVRGIYQRSMNNGGSEELLVTGGPNAPSDWTSDGRFILYARTLTSTRRDIFVLPLFGDRQPYPILASVFDEYRAQLSPDGRWVVYVSDESGSYEVYAQPFTSDGKLGGPKLRVSTAGGNHPRFRGDGQELFYVAADGWMMSVAVKAGASFEPGTPKQLFKTRMLTGMVQSGIEYDVTADGQRFLIGTIVGEGALPVSVILNWTAEVKK